MTTIYGLFALGDSVNGWRFRMFSKDMFTSRDAAQKYEPEFRRKCCDDINLECAIPDTLVVEIREYNLHHIGDTT